METTALSRSLFFDGTEQRVFSCSCKVHCLFRFHRGNFVGVYACNTHSGIVYLEHDRYRIGIGAVEHVLQDKDDEIHCREIVIVKDHLKKLGLFELGFAFGNDFAAVFGKFGHTNDFATERTEKNRKEALS